MKITSTSRSGFVAILVIAALVLAGCGSSAATTGGNSTAGTPTASSQPASSKAVAARDELLQSVPGGDAPAYRYAAAGTCGDASGILDAANKTMTGTFTHQIPNVNGVLTLRIMAVDKKSWLKATVIPAALARALKMPSGWVSVDTAKVTDGDNAGLTFDETTDPAGFKDLISAAKNITRTSPGYFAGTTDLTQGADAIFADVIAVLGDKATTVPFIAAIDSDGHLSTMTVKIPAAGTRKAGTCTVTYDEYGTVKRPAVPTGAPAAPPVIYHMLNG